MQNTDFIARSYGAGDVLWSRGVCFGLVEGGGTHLYCFTARLIGGCCRESCFLFNVLRYRTPSTPICLSEVAKQAPRLFASIPLIQRKEKRHSREEKSAFT